MQHLASYIAGGLAVVLAIDVAAPRASLGGLASNMLGRLGLPTHASPPPSHVVDRTLKGDRLAPSHIGERYKETVATVEIVGLRNVAVVYRDRQGRELFRTDPVTNGTVAAKDVVLPEVTIRESGASTIRPVPISPPRVRTPEEDRRYPLGCESPVSPLVSPSASTLPGRCLTEKATSSRATLAFLEQ